MEDIIMSIKNIDTKTYEVLLARSENGVNSYSSYMVSTNGESPTADLFKAAIDDFRTSHGMDPSKDFNWKDALENLSLEDWKKYGITPMDAKAFFEKSDNPKTILQVNSNEALLSHKVTPQQELGPTQGSFGTCSWDIDKNGTLKIYPTNGEQGRLNAVWEENKGKAPWQSHSENIKKVVVEKGVVAARDSSLLFYGLKNCEAMDLKGLNTSKVEVMRGMFSGCKTLDSLDLSSFDTEKTQDMGEMFDGCTSLTNVNVSSFNTENVKTTIAMFAGCKNLQTLDLSNFKMPNLEHASVMFANCNALNNLDVSNFGNPFLKSGINVFKGCDNLSNRQKLEDKFKDFTLTPGEKMAHLLQKQEQYKSQKSNPKRNQDIIDR
jgi:surface protein